MGVSEPVSAMCCSLHSLPAPGKINKTESCFCLLDMVVKTAELLLQIISIPGAVRTHTYIIDCNISLTCISDNQHFTQPSF